MFIESITFIKTTIGYDIIIKYVSGSVVVQTINSGPHDKDQVDALIIDIQNSIMHVLPRNQDEV